MVITTMKVKKDTLVELRSMELHHRESNEDILIRLIKEVKNERTGNN